MRIGIAINTSWNIYNFREGLVKSFLNEGHDVIAIAPKDLYSEILIEWGCEYIDFPMSSTGANPWKELSHIRKYTKILKGENIDVLLTFTIKPNLYGTLAGKWVKIPVICNVSGLGTVFLTKGLKSSIAKLLYSLIFRFSSHIFFQNTQDRQEFEAKFPISADRLSVLPGSGINLQKFQPLKYPKNSGVRFLMISRLIIEKGVEEYAKAAISLKKKFPNHEFVLLGKLDESHARSVKKSELDSWINAGLLYLEPIDDVRAEISKADVIVLPSYREGMSRTLLEAGAFARPIITTDVPGCRDLVDDGINGFLCEAGEVRSLEDKMNKISLLDVKIRSEMGLKSREIVEKNFDEKKVINSYFDIIHSFRLKKSKK